MLPTQHSDYKLGVLRNILSFYPELSFILIGDSGQEDPEIYRAIVDEYPERILAIYIRDVTGASRSEEVSRLAKEVAGAPSTLLLAPDTLAMAEHALTAGWIHPETLELVAAAVQRDNEAPTEAEALLDEVT